MLKQKQKLGFTLVELIVVITILAILWTIAFISLQWYSTSARDSARISDISRIKTSLELFKIEWAKYPEPTNPVSIMYNSQEAWTQWDFWQTTFSNVDKLDRIPVDPTTNEPYIYSVTNTRKEFELLWMLEWDDLALLPGFPPNPPLLKGGIIPQQAEAWRWQKRARISGTYNGKVLKVTRWPVTSILAVPTIVATTDRTLLEEIIANKELIADGSTWTWETLVNADKVVVYEWAAETLQTLEWKKTLLQWIQSAYNGTETAKKEWMTAILTADTSNNQVVQQIAWSLVNTNIIPTTLTTSLASAKVEIDSNCGTTAHGETKDFWNVSVVSYEAW